MCYDFVAHNRGCFITKYFKLMPPLLIVASIIFVTSDQMQFQSKLMIQSFTPEGVNEGRMHSHGDENMNQSDPEAQKPMGIYHYNEGNKFLKQNNWEKAISSYKMALHHNNNFDEAYINLSTAYLVGKKFEASLKTLNTLQRINPKHPLLHYNLACYYALKGNTTLGIESLKQAVTNRFNNIQTLKTDPDLENLRPDPRFKELQESLSSNT